MMKSLSLNIFIPYRQALSCRTGLAVVVELQDVVHYATMKPPSTRILTPTNRYQPELRLKWRPHRYGRISEPNLSH
ncbi:hypothetical protein CDV36_015154 [Fusarium kuroshium]|uniref:Uncharacterized protein n=1 Tax=Fusarium kuroshium TaxID=2010991 RepID=A0A3M2RDK1_9HYPO|nr:hypothetical protein CDV36_015154 [Fusarium kuroshium]